MLNNCCLCLPMRGGGMWLSGLNVLTNAIGAAFLFLWGSFFFSSAFSAIITGGFSILQALTALIAFLALYTYSYMLTRMFVFTQWLLTFVSAARIGFIAFELQQNRDRIAAGCDHPKSSNAFIESFGSIFCKASENNNNKTSVMDENTLILMFLVGLGVDWILNGYMYFVVWRFFLQMRLYPEKWVRTEEFTEEEALDEL
ncbi:hypothetical protein EDD11_002773 [Mortierella claussenii]|nr:hypothetical protein EDD11_002773 [Mortierella claussenii]